MGFFTVFPDKYPDTTLVVGTIDVQNNMDMCVRAVFDSILNTFFLEFVQAQDLLGFVALGPRTPIFKNWV